MEILTITLFLGVAIGIVAIRIETLKEEARLKIDNLHAKIAELEDEIDQLRMYYGEEED